MPKLPLTVLLLTCALTFSGCGRTGKAALRPESCPQLPPPPASLMQPSNYESRVRQILFDSEPKPTPKNADSRK